MDNQVHEEVKTDEPKVYPVIFNQYYLFSIVHKNPEGMWPPIFMIPFRRRVRDRSKYQPHQGKRECERRLKG
jgi:hypothetical protein